MIHNFSEWKKINEADTSLTTMFTNMAKAAGSAIIFPLTSLISIFKKLFGKNPERVSLIFPKDGWETTAVDILKRLGVVTGVFKSIQDAIQTVKGLKKEGVKAKELVIGSHGDGETLLITQKNETSATELLKNLKDVITPDSKVFFTACHGADYLMRLVDSANILGVGVYGSMGIYNYVANSSEKGYYYCKPYKVPGPKIVANPRDEFYSGKLELEENGYRKEKGSLNIKFWGPFGKNPKMKITFTPASFSDLGWQLKSKTPLSFTIIEGKIDVDKEDYGTKDGKHIYEYDLFLDNSDFAWEDSLDQIGFTSLSKLMKNKEFKWPESKRNNFGTLLKKSIEKGTVKMMLGDVDLSKERPKMKGHFLEELKFDNNSHLIKCGACKKVNTAPISWITPKLY